MELPFTFWVRRMEQTIKNRAYTQYHGMNGYVPMDDLDPASREEAASEEYRTFGGKDADFEVKGSWKRWKRIGL